MMSPLAVLALLALATSAHGFAVSVDAHEKQCFFEDVKSGTKMGLTFQVADGGFLDIDVTITGPDEKEVYAGRRESDGKYTFSAHMDGRYKYCFSNEMSSVTNKLVVFSMYVEGQEGIKDTLGDEAEIHDNLHEMIQELAEQVVTVRREQEYMVIRERTHRMINDSTNSRVVYWAFFEALILVLMSVGQVYYLHRFFEVRHTV
ncbi:uncharacterized protein MONBRDRAFT_34870 [Monosiga brevicollis MX1]|uniref:GOLD domain-containing protein n=1 Tax=Monosiga brevicollis TaxID=81824 RepID=A9UQI0_MONBE|nr:uncharacterized protein MONBRDRAFT_34870 [Monosiga brevicollis MX1]EDQ92602.1 predicted protein [Monosiga brevicollis MX1]|eukprot:XP_001742364.1 hypothetical protein [Monosiga brevicollis MX1]